MRSSSLIGVMLLLVTACHGVPRPAATVGASTPPSASALPPDPAPVVGTCQVDADPPEGSHDRYPFQDPATQRWGYKTGGGVVVIPPRYKDASGFTAGGVASVRVDGGWRFIDPSGASLATPFPFDNGADYFQEGFARIVDPAGKVGFLSQAGQIVVSPRYDFAYAYCHGVAKTALGGHAGYLDTRGTSTAGPADDDRPLIPPHSDG
ncbi:MAG: WG repeat-containing protein [Proteobacteria bacterium]|nr:WG repeat-containing protein [Pseudomonadota bacterium]